MTETNRESFIFYRSFFDALIDMDKENQADCLMAIADYALNGKEPKMTPAVRMFFTLIKPQLDANQKKYESGCKGGKFGKFGGRPKKNPKETPQKPQENPKETPNDNDNDNVNDNVYIKENFIKEKKSVLIDNDVFFIDQSMDDYKDLLQNKSDEFCLKVWKWIMEKFQGKVLTVDFIRSLIERFDENEVGS